MRPSSENVFVLERVADALDPRLVLGGLELGVLSFAIASSIAALRSGVSSRWPSARRRRVQHAALLGRELGLDQVGRLLRVRARDLELVLQAAADRRDEDDQNGDDPDPARTTRHGCVAQARVQRASAPVESRSWAASRSEPSRPFSPFVPVPRSCSLISLPFRGRGFPLETGCSHRTHRSATVTRGGIGRTLPVVMRCDVGQPSFTLMVTDLGRDGIGGALDRRSVALDQVFDRDHGRVHGEIEGRDDVSGHGSNRRRDRPEPVAQAPRCSRRHPWPEPAPSRREDQRGR